MLIDQKFTFTPSEQTKIKELRERVLNCSALEIGTEEVFLTKFLYFTHWDVAKAFESICKYFDFKHEHRPWMAQHSVEYFRDHFLNLKAKFVMPQPDREGRMIIILKIVDAFDKYPNYLSDIVEMDDLIFESMLLLPTVQKNGISIIYDLSGITKNFLSMLKPQFSRLINAKGQIMPFTFRMVHIIQKGFLMNATSALIMPFISKEIKKKIKEHITTHDGKNFDKMRDLIGYENLPAEYGGPPKNVLDANILYDHMLQNSDYLLKLQSYRKCAD